MVQDQNGLFCLHVDRLDGGKRVDKQLHRLPTVLIKAGGQKSAVHPTGLSKALPCFLVLFRLFFLKAIHFPPLSDANG